MTKQNCCLSKFGVENKDFNTEIISILSMTYFYRIVNVGRDTLT